jgi:aldehyde dehydrogenase (NAD+)
MAPSATTDSASTEGYKPKHIEDRLFINGEFVPSVSGKKFDLINPNTEKLSASVYEAGAEDVDLAVKAAQDAFPAWSALSAAERGGWLNKLADAIEKNIEEIGYLEAITMGKPYVGDSMFGPPPVWHYSTDLISRDGRDWRSNLEILRQQSCRCFR